MIREPMQIVDRGARWGLLFVALFVAFACALLFRIGDAPVSSGAEHRCTDVIQGMLETGDWIVPRRGGDLWMNKPPLYYWMGAVTAKLFGRFDGFVLRLPAALSALALVLLTSAWARRLRPGGALQVLAPFLLLAMIEVFTQGRKGVVDMPLALAANLALFLFVRLHAARDRRLLPLFAVALAVGVLAKATVMLLLVGLPIFLFLASRRELRDARRRPVLLWTTGALVAGFAWYPVVFVFEPAAWERVWNQLVLPVGVVTSDNQAAKHYGPFYDHVSHLVSAALPTVLLLPAVFAAAWRTRLWRGSADRRFLAIVFTSLFVAFSLIPQKRQAYLLPLLPSIALLTGDVVLDVIDRRGDGSRRLRRAFSVGVAGLGVLVPVAIGTYLGVVLDMGPVAWLPLGLASLFLGVAAAVLAARGHWTAACATAGALWGVMLLVDYGSLDIWKRQFHVGSAVLRPDYDEEHWTRLKARYPEAARGFRAKDVWVERYFGSPPDIRPVELPDGQMGLPPFPPARRTATPSEP